MRAASRSAAVSVTVAWAQGTWAQAVPARPLVCGQPDQFIRKKGSGKAKVEVRDKLRDLHKELDAGYGRVGDTPWARRSRTGWRMGRRGSGRGPWPCAGARS
jgi:hypothetical protein